MKAFIDKTFLLDNQTGIHMYHQYCEIIPVTDYHCRLSIRDIVQNKTYENLSEFFILNNPDRIQTICRYHQKNVSDVSDFAPFDLFLMYVQAIEHAIGSPEYVICHMELEHFFGYNGPVSTKEAQNIWDFCNRKLAYPNMCYQRILEENHVHYLNIEEDLCADLSDYETLQKAPLPQTTITPLLYLTVPHIGQMEALSNLGFQIHSLSDYLDAVSTRMEQFKSCGCVSLLYPLFYCSYPATEDLTNATVVFDKLLHQKTVSNWEYTILQNELLYQIALLCSKNGLVLMLDTCNVSLFDITNVLSNIPENELPKLFFYTDYADSIIKAYSYPAKQTEILTFSQIKWQYPFAQNNKLLPKTPKMLEEQMLTSGLYQCLCSASGAYDFSLLAYADYYRRHLSNTLGSYIENGYYPKDFDFIKTMLENICYHNVIDMYLE